MKKAFFLSILIHIVVFAGDYGIDFLSNYEKKSVPITYKRGFSVEIISENVTPSVKNEQTGNEKKNENKVKNNAIMICYQINALLMKI